MLICFSEVLAIVPYLLRSLRIQKMFSAREIYCITDLMPKNMIWRWREDRIIKIFLSIVLFVTAVYMTLGFLNVYGIISMDIPNWYSLSVPMQMHGKICRVAMTRDMGITNAFISAMSFMEYVLLCWALNAQWQIESEYNIFVELLLVTVVWAVSNTLLSYSWIINENFDEKLSLNQLRWYDFTFLLIRSLCCIIITSIKPIIDSFF